MTSCFFSLLFWVVDADSSSEESDTHKPCSCLVCYSLLSSCCWRPVALPVIIHVSLSSMCSEWGTVMNSVGIQDDWSASTHVNRGGCVLCPVWKCLCALGRNFPVRNVDVCHAGHLSSHLSLQPSSNTYIKGPQLWFPALIWGVWQSLSGSAIHSFTKQITLKRLQYKHTSQ